MKKWYKPWTWFEKEAVESEFKSVRIICNKIKTPDGTILESFYRHDYKTHLDVISGELYMVDGGCNYLRRNINTVKFEELSVSYDSPHEEIREVFTWGTYGKNGDEPYQSKFLKDLTTNHINSIIKTQVLPDYVAKVMKDELEFRK